MTDIGTAEIQRVARGGALNLAGSALAGLAGLGVTWLVARGLGTGEAGAFFAATAALVLAGAVAKLGTQTALVYWPARLRTLGRTDLLTGCLRTGLWPVAVASCVLGAALYAVSPNPQLRTLAFFLPLSALTDALLAATRGYRSMRPTVLIDRIARPALQLAALGLAVALGLSDAAYPLAWAGPYLPAVALAAAWLWRLHRRNATPGGGPIAAEFWRFTAPRALAGVAQIALQRLDILLVAALAGLAPAAVYAVATRFVLVGQFANQAVSQAVQPRLAELLSAGDTVAAGRLYQTATGWVVLLVWPLYLLVAVHAPLYLGLFGPAYAGGTAVVVVIASAMLVATGCGMIDMVLAMAGRTTWNLANVALALGVTLAVDLPLVPRLGALGAAIGLAAAALTNNLVPLAQVAHTLKLHPFGRGTLTAATLAAVFFGLVPAFVALAFGTSVLSSAAAVALGGAGYLLACGRYRHTLALSHLAALRKRP